MCIIIHTYTSGIHGQTDKQLGGILTWKVKTLVVDICLIWKHDGYFGMVPCTCRSEIYEAIGSHDNIITYTHALQVKLNSFTDTYVTRPATISHVSAKNCLFLLYHNLLTVDINTTKSLPPLQNLMGFLLQFT